MALPEPAVLNYNRADNRFVTLHYSVKAENTIRNVFILIKICIVNDILNDFLVPIHPILKQLLRSFIFLLTLMIFEG
jgi:hypothetical protein